MVTGIDAFLNKLSITNKKLLDEIFKNSSTLGIVNFVLVDSVDKIKKIEMESWYRSYANKNFGIWLGSGISDQFSINVIQRTPYMRGEVPNSFCFVVNRGKAEYVKYVEKFDINSK